MELFAYGMSSGLSLPSTADDIWRYIRLREEYMIGSKDSLTLGFSYRSQIHLAYAPSVHRHGPLEVLRCFHGCLWYKFRTLTMLTLSKV